MSLSEHEGLADAHGALQLSATERIIVEEHPDSLPGLLLRFALLTQEDQWNETEEANERTSRLDGAFRTSAEIFDRNFGANAVVADGYVPTRREEAHCQ